MNDILKLRNIRKRSNGFVLEADFQIHANERMGIVGRSGIGKSTLLRVISGLDPLVRPADSGSVELGEVDMTTIPVQRRDIGFVFQEQALFSGRTVFENVGFGLKMRGIGKAELKVRVDEWLEKLGLANRATEEVDHLSGGERQRVALARALVIRPKVLLMDEPFTGLDSSLRDRLCGDIERLHSENPIPLLFVTHDERELERLANGRLIFEEFENSALRRVKRVESQ